MLGGCDWLTKFLDVRVREKNEKMYIPLCLQMNLWSLSVGLRRFSDSTVEEILTLRSDYKNKTSKYISWSQLQVWDFRMILINTQ